MHNFKRTLRTILDQRLHRHGHLALGVRQMIDLEHNARRAFSDIEHVDGAAEWLARAQDATVDGGVMGRYSLTTGWTSSYPETTGYLIPTFLDLGRDTGDGQWHGRARRCVEFLLRLQMPSGAFPGGEVHEGTDRASIFNSAQIINGLTAWYSETGDERTLLAIRRAADWLCEHQDADGAWRRHVYNGIVTTYTAHASCWLAEAGQVLGEQRYIDAAVRHMDWVLSHRDPSTGWIDLMGFVPEDHHARRSVTHTIAYTYWGLLQTALIVGRDDVVAAVEQAALGIGRRIQLSGRLPGVLDSAWRSQSDYVCLTGNAQMALILFRLFELNGDGRHLNAALIALDGVKRAQPIDNPNPGVRGGIPGSWPVWGGYIYSAIPNWAAKFFIDAMRVRRRLLGTLSARRSIEHHESAAIPCEVPPDASGQAVADLRIVLLASPASRKVAQMMEQWSSFGFRPTAVIVEDPADLPIGQRVLNKVRQDGLGWVIRRLTGRASTLPGRQGDAESFPMGVAEYCAKAGVRMVAVRSLSSSEGVDALRTLAPDLCIHAGAGILRSPILGIPRLGTLNAHMGMLPFYRGMNVTEWSIFNRERPGCTVHVIDVGIDTGDIICAQLLPARDYATLQSARAHADEVQIELLGQVVRYVLMSGELPLRHHQRPQDGVQYFLMHQAIRDALDLELSRTG